MTDKMRSAMNFIKELEWELAFQASTHDGDRLEYFFTAKTIIRMASKGITWLGNLNDDEYNQVYLIIDDMQTQLHNWFYRVG